MSDGGRSSVTDEQVEAGAIVVWNSIGDPSLGSEVKWEEINDRARSECRTIARAVLEAAGAVNKRSDAVGCVGCMLEIIGGIIIGVLWIPFLFWTTTLWDR